MSKRELSQITGGTLTSTMINAIVKGISIIIELGKSLGTVVRRSVTGETCPLK